MKVNIDYMVISIFICVAMISQGIIWAADTNEDPDPDGLYGVGGTEAVEEAKPEKANILGSVILIGALILPVVGIAVLTIRLLRR